MTLKDSYQRVFADDKGVGDFEELATYIVDTDCSDINGNKLTGHVRDTLIKDFSINMHIGSESTKDKYLVQGMAVGVTILCVSFIGGRLLAWKRRKNESKKTAEEDQM